MRRARMPVIPGFGGGKKKEEEGEDFLVGLLQARA